MWLGNKRASLTWEQWCQLHLGTIVPFSLLNNCASVTWQQSCQCHLRTMVPVYHGNNCASVTWEQSCYCQLGTIVPVSLGNNCGSITWEQPCQCHLGIIVAVSLGCNCASFTWEQSCKFNIETNFCLTKEMGNDIKYLRSFSLQNWNVSICYIANNANTFNKFKILRPGFEEVFVVLEISRIQEKPGFGMHVEPDINFALVFQTW